jgi:tetratricopeptide (TPR) repeat protein
MIPFARTNEAFAHLDEAMMPVLADQVPVDWAGDIYCAVIHECHRLADMNRMKTWFEAIEQWREGPQVSTSWYGTTCEVHKMDLHSATKDYRQAEARLIDAIAAMGDFPATAGKGYYELGELRRRQGDIEGARTAFAKAREHNRDPQPGEALLRCQLGEDAAAWNDLRMRMDAEQDAINRVRLLPAAVEIALARDRVDEADRYCSEGLTTLVGFDSAANLAEEAKDPFRSVPRAIVSSVAASAVLGLLFVVTLTLAIKDIPRVSTSASPVASIIHDQLGPVMERILLTGIAFAMFSGGMVMMASCSRMVYAMARDSRFPRKVTEGQEQP